MKAIKNKKVIILIVLTILIVGSILLSFLLSQKETQSKYTKNSLKNYPLTSSKMYISSDLIINGSNHVINDYDEEEIEFNMYNYSGSNLSNVAISYNLTCTTNNSNYECIVNPPTGNFTNSNTQQSNSNTIKVEKIDDSIATPASVIATLSYQTTTPYSKTETCTITFNNEVATNPVAFETDSWATIIEAARTGNVAAYNVGDEKDVDLGDYGTLRIRISNMSNSTECQNNELSESGCGFVLEFVDIITERSMNSTSTNLGGWQEADLRTFINTDIYNLLPGSLKRGLINTNVISGRGTSDSSNITTTDKLFLLSEWEIYKNDTSWDYSMGPDTSWAYQRQLDYYANNNVSLSGNTSYVNKDYNGYSTTYWWLRTAAQSNNTSFTLANFNTSATANQSKGVSPAMRIEYNPTLEDSSQFANDSWETIISKAASADVSEYNVGDSKKVDLGDLGNHRIRLANKSIEPDCYNTSGFSQTACGFVLEFEDIITTQAMNSTATNSGGWPSTSMRTYVNSTVYNALPTTLKNAIINTSVVSGHGSGSSSNHTSTDKLYLLDSKEVYGTTFNQTANSARGSERQLDVYQSKGVTTSSYTNAIKKYNGTNTVWWLRSANVNNTTYFFNITATGSSSTNSANQNYGVSPAMRIPYDNIAPTKPTVQAYYKNDDTAYSSGTWTNRELKVDLTTTDNFGIAKFQVATSTSGPWTDVNLDVSALSNTSGTTWTGTATIPLANATYTYYYRAVDKAGNVSLVTSELNIKYDTVPPTCKISRGKSPVYNKYYWSISDSRSGVYAHYVSPKQSSWDTTGGYTNVEQTVSNAGTYTVYGMDTAGNTCSAKINAYTIGRTQGTGTTLVTRRDSSSSSTGTQYSGSLVALAGTSVWAQTTANAEYKDVKICINPSGSTSQNCTSTSNTSIDTQFTVSENTKIVSTATRKTYRIDFNNNGGTGGQSSPVYVTRNAMMPTISTTAPTKTNYVFQGWASTDNTEALTATVENNTSTLRINLFDNTSWSFNSSDSGKHLSAKFTITDNSRSTAPSLEFNDIVLTQNTHYTVTTTGHTFTYYVEFDITNQMVSSRDFGYDTSYRFIDVEGVSSTATSSLVKFGLNGTFYYDYDGTPLRTWNKSTDATLYAVWKVNVCNVTFLPNLPTGYTASGMPTLPQYYCETNITLPTQTPTNATYNFVGWNTMSNGSGTSYTPGQTINNAGNIILHAQWQIKTYTVTYYENPTMGVTTNMPTNGIKTHGQTYTISTTVPVNTVKAFAYWNTKADGTGTTYYSGSSYTQNANLELYAQWRSLDTKLAVSTSLGFRSSPYLSNIKTVTINDSINTPADAIAQWDVSEAQDGSIIAYVVQNSSDNTKYDLYIESNGNIYANEDSSYLFAYMSSLTTINNINLLDTSETTDMSSMFEGCQNLTSLDLSNFNTELVNDMSNMFRDCSSATSINVTNFDTSLVTDMSYMFSGCTSLTNLNVSGFDTYYVTDMSYMFNNCSSLGSVNVNAWDTSNVTNMEAMFRNCSSFTSLNINNFQTGKVTDMSSMFEGCSSLTNLNVSSFDTYLVTDMSNMFFNCSSLTSLNVSNFNTIRVTDFSNMFYNCNNLTSLNLSIFNTIHATDMSNMFYNVTIGVNIPYKTGTIQNTTSTYYVSTTSVYATGNFILSMPRNTIQVQNSLGFRNNTYKAKITTITFNDSIDPPSGYTASWDISQANDGSVMAYVTRTGNNNQSYRYQLYIQSNGIICANQNSQQLFDGMTLLTTINNLDLFDTSDATDMSRMFNNCTALTTFDVSDFNTINVTNMTQMFKSCSALTTLDVSGWNTRNVTNMSQMFSGSSRITSLNLSGWNTSKITNMSEMFNNCSGLTSLNVSSFDTSKVTNMNKMFYGCSTVTSLAVNDFNTANVTNMQEMFRECSNITSLDLSDWDTSKVTNMSGMFRGCSAMTSIDLTGFSTLNVTNTSNMFYGCTGLTSLNLTSFNTSKVDRMTDMFRNMTITIDIPRKTGNQNNTSTRYYGKTNRVYATGTFNIVDPDNTIESASLFEFKETLYIDKIKTITFNSTINIPATALESWDVSQNQDGSIMAYIIANTSDGTKYDLYIECSGEIIANSDNSSIFSGMTNLTTINNINILDTSNVTSFKDYFAGCSSLTTLDISSFESTGITDTSGMFSDCSSLVSLNVTEIDTSLVTDMSNMFFGCSSLQSLNIMGFVTNNVTDMTNMFNGCSTLETLDITNFTTTNVTSMKGMFYNCTNLTEIDVSRVSSTNVTDTSYMFGNCTGLSTLDLRNFNMSNATNMTNMFSNMTIVIFIPPKTGTISNTETRYYGSSSSVYATGIFQLALPSNELKSNLEFKNSTYLTNIKTITFNDSINTPSSVVASWDVSRNQDGSIIAYVKSNASDNTKYDLFIEANGMIKPNEDNTSPFSYMTSLTSITNLEVLDTTKVSNMSNWFYNCSSLSSIDLSSFYTNKVTNMNNMFYNCSSLTSLDLTNFDTNLVTNMANMFQGCSNVTQIDVTNFETSAVTNMSSMFNGCTNLTTLDTTDFDTSDVVDMSYMFYGCNHLQTLNVANFNTSTVQNMSNMFNGCSAITELNVSGFNTSRVTNMTSMFQDVSSITNLDVSRFNTSSVQYMQMMFSGCSSLTSLDVSNFNTQQVTSMASMFNGCSSLSTLNVSTFRTNNVSDMSNMFYGCTGLTSLNVTDIDTSLVTTMQNMFYNCSSVTSLDVTSFNTGNVTNMSGMFYNCSSLSTIDVSGFNTDTVTDFSTMFSRCTGLTTLELTSFDARNATNMSNMFYNMVISIYIPYYTNTIPNTTSRYYGSSTSVYATGTFILSKAKYILRETDQLQFRTNSRYKTNITVIQFNDSIQTHSGATATWDLSQEQNGAIMGYLVQTSGNGDNARYTLYIESNGIICANQDSSELFDGMTRLTTITNLNQLNTMYTTDMSKMFNGCTALTTADVSGFNTSKVTDMSNMFYNCSQLGTISVNNFDTKNVTTTSGMFSGCSRITSLNLSGWNVSKVTTTDTMFYNCSQLTTLNISGWSTPALTDTHSMFYGCSNVSSLAVGNLSMSNVTNIAEMFRGCSSLTSLDLRRWNTRNVTSMSGTFRGCSGLRTIDVSGWNTAKVTTTANMFRDCTRLTELNLSNFNMTRVTAMNDMFTNVTILIDIPSSTGSIQNTSTRYYGSSSSVYATGRFNLSAPRNTIKSNPEFKGTAYKDRIRTITFSSSNAAPTNAVASWDISDNQNSSIMAYIIVSPEDNTKYDLFIQSEGVMLANEDNSSIFNDLSNLKSISNINLLDTSNVTSMADYFSGCGELTSLDISSFDTRGITSTSNMFEDCSSLTTLNITGLDTSDVTNMSNMFEGCSSLTSIQVASFDTSNVTDMSNMFKGCSTITSLSVNSFDTSSVTNISGMFEGCSSLASLQVSNWDTTNITNASSTFSGCTALTVLNLRSFDMSHATSMTDMFKNMTIQITIPQSTGSIQNTTTRYYGSSSSVYATGNFSIASQNYELKSNLEFKGTSYINKIKTITFNKTINTPGNAVASWDVSKAQDNSIIAYIKTNTSDNTKYDLVIESYGITEACSENTSPFSYMTSLTTINNLNNFDTNKVTDMSYWFAECNSLTAIDLTTFDTSNVTNMNHMFYNCQALTALDVSRFATDKVTNMAYMFATNAHNLTTIDVSGFDTAKVTNMEYMFAYCYAVTVINVSGFNTEKVTKMNGMFNECNVVTTLDISGFNTIKVTDMSYMFNACGAVTALNVTGFNTSLVTNMESMFNGCTSITSLNVTGFDTSKVTNMEAMFCYCSLIQILDLTNFDTRKVTTMSYMFSRCQSLNNLIINGPNFVTDRVAYMTYMFQECDSLTTIDFDGFDTGNVIEMDGMFSGSGVVNLDLTFFDTRNVTNMTSMFYDCTALRTVDVSSFDTSSLVYAANMFYNCRLLQSLDLTNFDMSHAQGMNNMFYNVYITISIPNKTGTISNTTTRYYGSTTGVYATGTFAVAKQKHHLKETSSLEFRGSTYLTRITSIIIDDELNPPSDPYQTWNIGLETSTAIKAYVTRSGSDGNYQYVLYIQSDGIICTNTNSSQLFKGMTRLTSITGLELINTSDTTNMSEMFSGDTALTSINLTNFNTRKVTSMSDMFYNCSSLTSLDVSGFDTRNVTTMYEMFRGCSRPTTIDVSGFDTSKVTTMQNMFYGCSALNQLDLDDWNTSNVTNMNAMFRDCSQLTSLDLDSFSTGSVTNMNAMFRGCSRLTSISVTSFDTRNVTNTGEMFRDCRRLTTLDVTGFNMSKATQMSDMFRNMTITIDIPATTGTISNTTRIYYGSRNSVNASGTFRLHTHESSVVVRAATCTEDGLRRYICTQHTIEETIPKLGHNYENGICTRCGAEMPSEIIIESSHTQYGFDNNYIILGTWDYTGVNVDIEITYQTESTSYDWASLTQGLDYIEGTDYSETRTYLTTTGSLTSTTGTASNVKFGGATMTTLNFYDVAMQTGTVVFKTNETNSSYYGIYVKITPHDDAITIIETTSHTSYNNNQNYVELGTWDYTGHNVDIEITYQTQSTSYDWAVITAGTDWISGTGWGTYSYNQSRIYINTSGSLVTATATDSQVKFGGTTKTTKTFTNVNMPTGTVVFKSNGYDNQYYGIYVKITRRN